MKKKVLLLCTHNSCRSQMAEGIVNHFLGERFQAFSAGTRKTRVNPLAIRALAEIGIDISSHYSKTLDQFEGEKFDHVITLCDSANEECPLHIGGVRRVHMGFGDPSATRGSEEEVMADFRRVRDEIMDKLLIYLRQFDQ